MMTEATLNRLAMNYQMQSGFRFLECLHCLAVQYRESISVELFVDIKKDFDAYKVRMVEAGFTVMEPEKDSNAKND